MRTHLDWWGNNTHFYLFAFVFISLFFLCVCIVNGYLLFGYLLWEKNIVFSLVIWHNSQCCFTKSRKKKKKKKKFFVYTIREPWIRNVSCYLLILILSLRWFEKQPLHRHPLCSTVLSVAYIFFFRCVNCSRLLVSLWDRLLCASCVISLFQMDVNVNSCWSPLTLSSTESKSEKNVFCIFFIIRFFYLCNLTNWMLCATNSANCWQQKKKFFIC